MMHVVQCDPSRPHLACLQSVHVTRRELFYLRTLLLSQPGISWVDLRTVDGVVYSSFQAAAITLGLFVDQNEAQFCMQEAVSTLHTPHQLCILFVHLLTNSCTNTPSNFGTSFRTRFLKTSSWPPSETLNEVTTRHSRRLDHFSKAMESGSASLDYHNLWQTITKLNANCTIGCSKLQPYKNKSVSDCYYSTANNEIFFSRCNMRL